MWHLSMLEDWGWGWGGARGWAGGLTCAAWWPGVDAAHLLIPTATSDVNRLLKVLQSLLVVPALRSQHAELTVRAADAAAAAGGGEGRRPVAAAGHLRTTHHTFRTLVCAAGDRPGETVAAAAAPAVACSGDGAPDASTAPIRAGEAGDASTWVPPSARGGDGERPSAVELAPSPCARATSALACSSAWRSRFRRPCARRDLVPCEPGSGEAEGSGAQVSTGRRRSAHGGTCRSQAVHSELPHREALRPSVLVLHRQLKRPAMVGLRPRACACACGRGLRADSGRATAPQRCQNRRARDTRDPRCTER